MRKKLFRFTASGCRFAILSIILIVLTAAFAMAQLPPLPTITYSPINPGAVNQNGRGDLQLYLGHFLGMQYSADARFTQFCNSLYVPSSDDEYNIVIPVGGVINYTLLFSDTDFTVTGGEYYPTTYADSLYKYTTLGNPETGTLQSILSSGSISLAASNSFERI